MSRAPLGDPATTRARARGAEAPDRHPITRRRVLGLGVAGATAMLALRVLRIDQTPPRGCVVLGRGRVTTLERAGECLLDPGSAAGAAAPDLEHLVTFVDGFLARAHPGVRDETVGLLVALEVIGPLTVGRLARFSSLSPEERAAVLERWATGPKPLRMGYAGLKQLCFMAHYARPETWPAIGYDGPIVPAGFTGGDAGWFEPAWMAPPGDPRDGTGCGGRATRSREGAS